MQAFIREIEEGAVHIIFDMLAVVILLTFTYNGYKKGLIYTVLRLAISIAALAGALIITKMFSGVLAQALNPAVSGWVTGTLESGGGGSEAMKLLLGAVGVPQNTLSLIAGGAAALNAELISWISGFVSDYAAYMLLFILSYTILTVILKAVLRAVNLISKLPVIKVFNRLGGFVAGFALGCLVLCIVVWVVTFSGGLASPDIIAKTVIFSKFVELNPLNRLALI